MDPKHRIQLENFIDHLKDLRRCLVRSMIAIAIGMAVTLYFSEDIFRIFMKPLQKALGQDGFFQAVTLFETMKVYFDVSLLSGFLLAAPYVAFEVWRFITPGLYQNERKRILQVAFATAFFFVGGALFGYFVVFPATFEFAASFNQGGMIRFIPKISENFSIVVQLLFAFGIVFELPLLMILLAKLGFLKYAHVKKYRKYVIVVIFILAGVLTPGPDIMSQMLMAGPLLFLFELGGLVTYFVQKKKD